MQKQFILTAFAATAMLLPLSGGSALAHQPLGKNDLADVEAKAHRAVEMAENLEDEMVAELSNPQEKQLVNQVEQVLLELAQFQSLLRKGAPERAKLYQRFDRIDAELTKLTEAIAKSASKHPSIRRGAGRLRMTINDLDYTLSKGDASAERRRQALVRQSNAMSDVTQTLFLTAEYMLADSPGRGELLANMKKLAKASKEFETIAAGSADLETCKQGFATLNDAWSRVVRGVRLLTPAENAFLLRSALHADLIHERLFQLLKMPGERTALAVGV